MKADVILGLQWGDEGKGKIVDVFAPRYDIIARFQGGPNAGHTIEFDGKKFILHTVPSGIFHPEKQNVIGNGVIIDPYILMQEIDMLHSAGLRPEENLMISRRAHLILPSHRLLDAALEASRGSQKIGSTLKGIGPAYTDKYGRSGIRTGDIRGKGFESYYKEIRKRHLETVHHYNFDQETYLVDGLPFSKYEERWFESLGKLDRFRFIDSEFFLNGSLAAGKTILAEGAQGSLLDIDFGSYPYVTSSSTITAGVCSGLGLPPHSIGRVYGVFKAYSTRVGGGPFPTELHDETGNRIRQSGNEFGSTTGRPRRIGWLDLPALKYSVMLNGVSQLIMMKADVLNFLDEIQVCHSYETDGEQGDRLPFDLGSADIRPVYETLAGWNSPVGGCRSFSDLPENMSRYIAYIERAVGLPVAIISLGPDRVQTIIKKSG